MRFFSSEYTPVGGSIRFYLKFSRRSALLLSHLLLSNLTAILLGACAHDPAPPCQEVDWYEIGRRDGLKGLIAADRKAVKPVCGASEKTLSINMYESGYNAGISVFCSKKSGFELGRAGRQAPAVLCPALLQEEFAAAVEDGKKFTELEKSQYEIEQKLKRLEVEMRSNLAGINGKQLLRAQKLELQNRKTELSGELAKLKSQLEKSEY